MSSTKKNENSILKKDNSQEIVEDNKKKPNYKEQNNWGLLISKHPLRFKIWSILNLFGQMNVTQISKLVKESKSTVSRVTSKMEKDFLIFSKSKESDIEGRLPSKFYHIDIKTMNEKLTIRKISNDQNKRIDYYRTIIQENKAAIEMIESALSELNPLINEFENQLGNENQPANMEKADKIFKKYFQGRLEPMFYFSYTDDIDLEIQDKIWKEGEKKYKKELDEQKENSLNKDFISYSIKLPMKELLKFHEDLEKEKKLT